MLTQNCLLENRFKVVQLDSELSKLLLHPLIRVDSYQAEIFQVELDEVEEATMCLYLHSKDLTGTPKRQNSPTMVLPGTNQTKPAGIV